MKPGSCPSQGAGAQLAAVNLAPQTFHGDRNCIISPDRKNYIFRNEPKRMIYSWTRPTVATDIPSGPASATPVALKPLPQLIFASRWLQVPLYLGPIVAQIAYVFLSSKNSMG